MSHLLAPRYPDGQLHACLRGTGAPRCPEEVLRAFLTALGTTAGPDWDADACQAAFRSALAGRRMLIVLDDAKDAAQVRPLLAGSAGCATLITSRTRLAELPGSRLVHLSGLESPDALAMLAGIVGADRVAAEPAASADLVGCCAGLPLALDAERQNLAAITELAVGYRQHDLAWRLPWLLEEFFLSRSYQADWVRAGRLGLQSARQADDAVAEAEMLKVLANYCGEAGDLESSLCYRRRALSLYRSQRSAAAEAATTASIGFSYLSMARYPEAITWCRRAIPLLRAHGTRYALAAALNGLASAYDAAGQSDLAMAAFQEALQAAIEAGSRFALAGSLDGTGWLTPSAAAWPRP